jgi:hypothetical protein
VKANARMSSRHFFAQSSDVLQSRRRRYGRVDVKLHMLTALVALIAAASDDQKSKQERVIATVKRLKGEIQYVNEKPGNPVFRITLEGQEVTDDDLMDLDGFPDLKELRIGWSKITDSGLKHIRGLTKLEVLHLDNDTNVTDTGIKHLSGMKELKNLSLQLVPITDAGLKTLSGFTKLEWLWLQHAKITDQGLGELKPLQNLKELSLSHVKIGNAALVHLTGLRKLENLFINDTKVTNIGLFRLKSLTSLRSLNVEETAVTRAGAESLKSRMPELRITIREPNSERSIEL